MPKLEKKQNKKGKPVKEMEPDNSVEKTEDTGSKDYSKTVKQIEGEYNLSYWFIKPKWDEWALRLKLYNNQKRDKSAVGDNTLFTIHQTILAALYDDRLAVSFSPREEGDSDTAENLDAMAEYDYDEMEKDVVDYDWDWDTTFFGRGLCMLMEFNKEAKCPIPEVWDPMTTYRDPNATSVNGDRKGRGASRFIGREIRLSKQQMRDAEVYFNFEDLKPDASNLNSLVDRNRELRQQAQGYSDVRNLNTTLEGDNETHLLLEWITKVNGKFHIVTLADNRKRVIRMTEIKGNKIPIIDRALYPISHDWDGVSIPDLVEDKQRARAKLTNLGLKVAESGLYPMYLFDTNKIKNKAELNFETNKFIGVDGNPTGAIQEMTKSHIQQDVSYIMNTLDSSAQKSTATPDLQQGNISQERRTATELNLIDKKVDTRYSLSAKVFGWSEKRFWQQWYFLYKTYFEADIDEKIVRLKGALGTQFRPLRRENIVAVVDPDVKVESKIVSDAKRYNELQLVRAYVQSIALDPNANLRFSLKYLGKLSGLKKDVVNQMLPPTIDELDAEDENVLLEKNKVVEVLPTDDHIIHMEIHNKLSDTPAKYAHINAHKKAMMLKKLKPELFPQSQNTANPTNGAGIGDKNLPAMVRGNNSQMQ